MHADQDILTEAIRAGANGYLVKDCSTDEIAHGHRGRGVGETALSPGWPLRCWPRYDARTARDATERVITAREEEVLQLIADGCSTPEVAEAAVHQPEDGQEPPGVDLPESSMPETDPSGPPGRAHGHRHPRLTVVVGRVAPDR